MELSEEKKKKISLGRECASYGCSNKSYNSVGQATGVLSKKVTIKFSKIIYNMKGGSLIAQG